MFQLNIFRILSHIGRGKSAVIILMMIFASLIESVGIATLLPVFGIASGEEQIQSEIAQKAIDIFRSMGVSTDMTTLCIMVAVALISREIIMFFTMSYIGCVISDMSLSYRSRLLTTLLSADWKYFSENELGSTSVQLTTFTENAATAVNLSARTLSLFIRTLFYLALIVLISGVFAFIAFCAGIVSLFALSKLVSLSKKYGDKKGNLIKKISAQFTDFFASIKSIKVMGRENNIAEFLSINFHKINKTLKNLVFLKEGLASLQRVIELFVVLTTLFIAVKFWGLEIIEVGVIGVLMAQVMMNISKSQQMLQKVMNLEVYFWQIHKTIDETEAAKEKQTGKRNVTLQKNIEFKDISFSFPNKKILNNESFKIPANKLTVIYGASGQGKTTLTDLVSRLYMPDDGSIMIDGIPLNKINLQHWRKNIGYVPQELLLLNGNIRDNVIFGRTELSDKAVYKALELSGSMEFVSNLQDGIDTHVGEKGMKLSGGQRQRLSIARGLVHNPSLLLLDEITSALDPENEKRICEQIKSLSDTRTIIAITHRPQWLKISDQVFHLKDAKIRTK